MPTRVLLVEDDSGDALLVQEFLGAGNGDFELTRVRTLAEAMALAGPGIDCVLLDLHLPDTDALDGLESLVLNDACPAVVVLTGLDDEALGAQALEIGAQDYLSKESVNEETLVRSVRYAIARQRSDEAARRLWEAELLQLERSRLERGLLPQLLVSNPDLTLAVRYRPGGSRTLLGGDFLDAVELEDGTIRALIGDVSGHGPDEAAMGVALRVAWRTTVLSGLAPDERIASVERLLIAERTSDEIFATICEVELSPDLKHATIRSCGHPDPLRIDGTTTGEVPLPARGPALGIAEPSSCPPSSVDLGEQWTLLLYTDGIVEGYDGTSSVRLGVDGLVEIISKRVQGAESLEALADAIINDAEERNGDAFHDDLAIIFLSNEDRWRR